MIRFQISLSIASSSSMSNAARSSSIHCLHVFGLPAMAASTEQCNFDSSKQETEEFSIKNYPELNELSDEELFEMERHNKSEALKLKMLQSLRRSPPNNLVK
ncbi:hypothetical protein GWK47_009911 [Chionoecetes opilio]|uniref:Uncharacterized protein n=1 Tax=Chionoecetes opilio TaxID=41210 RepID=A0A8J4Y2S4_CHIOP|nr:hypothetical protein GWK47_009911 [Chionoecetes opilio]